MQINKDKRIGRVLFIVEGSKLEFSLLKRIFCDIFEYSYTEKRRNNPDYFTSKKDKFSHVAVINTKESNIRDISENKSYFEDVFSVLVGKYQFPVDESAIYYLFDRDPKSNTNTILITEYIDTLTNPYENKNGYQPGQLLLSYPSIESYTITNFKSGANMMRFQLGRDAKEYISKNTYIQLNRITEETLINAANEFLDYLKSVSIEFDIDSFSEASHSVFTKQEADYLSGEGFRVFSMLTLAFLQMGILEI